MAHQKQWQFPPQHRQPNFFPPPHINWISTLTSFFPSSVFPCSTMTQHNINNGNSNHQDTDDDTKHNSENHGNNGKNSTMAARLTHALTAHQCMQSDGNTICPCLPNDTLACALQPIALLPLMDSTTPLSFLFGPSGSGLCMECRTWIILFLSPVLHLCTGFGAGVIWNDTV